MLIQRRLERLFGDARAQWFAVMGLVAAVNAMATAVLALFGSSDLLEAFHEAGALNPVVLFALFAVWAIAFEREPGAERGTIDGRDWAVLGTVALLTALPVPALGGVALTLTGAWLWGRGSPDSRERRIAIVLLALATRLLWGRFVMLALGDDVLALDAWFVGLLAGADVTRNTVAVEGGADILIGYACSSMHNITQALLVWAAFTQLLRIPLGWASLVVALLAVAANVLVNGVRLAMIVGDPARFEYWHSGAGGAVFAWAAMIAAGLVVGAGCHAIARTRA